MQLRKAGRTKLMVIGGMICIVFPAFAQQPISDLKEIQQIANNLSNQRNQAMDGVAVLQAKLQLAEEKIKELEQKVKQWEELQDKKDKKEVDKK